MNFLEVCITLRRGKQPSAVDCLIHEKVAVVIVLLAIKAAALAIIRTGQYTPPALEKKSFLNHHNKMEKYGLWKLKS